MRNIFLIGSLATIVSVVALSFIYRPVLWSLVFFIPVIGLSLIDYFQTQQTIRRKLDTLPFGTPKDVNANEFEWVNHSLPILLLKRSEISIGGTNGQQPCNASISTNKKDL